MDKIIFNDRDLNEFIKIVNDISGIDLNDKRNIIALKLDKFVNELGVRSVDEFLSGLRVNKNLKQKTIDFVTISETYFLRELTQLKEIIKYAKSLEKSVNILSAPCASGEEVYSLAILAAQILFKDLHIVGIDINTEVINEAKLALYQGRTLQRLSESEKRRFFTEEKNEEFRIKKNELCTCHFKLCNVFNSHFEKLGKFDIILSRNMIIYFDNISRMKLLEKFHKLLTDRGRLYVGNADLIPESDYFKKVFSIKGSYYEKITF
ncbi:methyltransferase domain-containing protein [Campylobacter sp. LR291e]|uniref:CheR family methyltransferase n=1 Tax=Campylobacter sp. LR291e TaxID=2593546 RepID=UPI00123A6AA2|nr:CheR family methyltransferase [Campylobacter sp. LR291e]KAA6234066.1 methyltransferase domain-containing protein [Campylobacter sp. LR291e]